MQLSPEQFHTLFDRAAQPVLLVQDGVITPRGLSRPAARSGSFCRPTRCCRS